MNEAFPAEEDDEEELPAAPPRPGEHGWRKRQPKPPVHVAPKDAVPHEGTATLTVPPEAAGMRLDTWLSRLEGYPTRSRIQQIIKDGRVRMNAAPADKSALVAGGEIVEIDWPPLEEPWPRAEPIPLDIVYEDDDLLVVNKQAGLITHPSAGNPDGTLVNAVLNHCPTLPGIHGVKRPGIVHRLDRDTTGLIVVAKTERAMTSLSKQLAARTAHRTYRALVIGDPPWDELRVDAAIGRDPINRLKRKIDGPFARNAASRFRVVARAHHHTLIEASLETGRTHQIRMHCEHIGFPIVGDELYLGAPVRSLERLRHASSALRAAFGNFTRPFLHAWRLEFIHPATSKPAFFEVPMPPDAAALAMLLWPQQPALLGERIVRIAPA